jgi:hypothetical protein
MQKLTREMATIFVDEYGADMFLRRVSDPFWFQAFVASWDITSTPPVSQPS